MNYITLKDATEHNPFNLYIGKGNPNRLSYLIGKEAAIDQNTNTKIYNRDIKNNNLQWIQNSKEHTTQNGYFSLKVCKFKN